MKVLEEGTNSAVELLSFFFCGAVEQPVQELVQNSWHEASCTRHPAQPPTGQTHRLSGFAIRALLNLGKDTPFSFKSTVAEKVS